VLAHLNEIDEHQRHAIGERARVRVLASHTSEHRAIELEDYVAEVMQTTTATPARTQPAGAIA
jgi:spore maturation protein CgeB